MATELEIKIRMSGPDEVRRVLRACQLRGRLIQPEIVQRDEYYDTADQALRRADLTLRLRVVEARLWVAMKSPRVFESNNLHRRIELEFEAASGSDVRQLIDRGGLRATAVIEKRRTKYQIEDRIVIVVVDVLPFAGTFVEVEGASQSDVLATVQELGLDLEQSVKENYSELLELELTRRGLPLRPDLRATFEAESLGSHKPTQ